MQISRLIKCCWFAQVFFFFPQKYSTLQEEQCSSLTQPKLFEASALCKSPSVGKLSCGVLAQSSLPVFKSSHLLFWSQKGRKPWLHLMPQMLLCPSLHPWLSPSVLYTHGRTYPCVFDGSSCILWCCSVWCWLIAESMNIHLLWCWMRYWIWSVRRQQAIMTYKAWYRGGKSCVCMRQPLCQGGTSDC